MLVRLSDIPEDELAGYELPPAHKKRRRASVGWGSCFRLEALPPTPGTASLFACMPCVLSNLWVCSTFLCQAEKHGSVLHG